jgi:hypothetical protein
MVVAPIIAELFSSAGFQRRLFVRDSIAAHPFSRHIPKKDKVNSE